MVCWFLLNRVGYTVLVDLLLLADEPAHPQRIAIVENQALVVRVGGAVILQDMRALLVLPKLKQILGQEQDSLQFRIPLFLLELVLLLVIRIAEDEALSQEALLDVVLGSHAHQQLAHPTWL